MCLGIPGQITSIVDAENRIATIEVSGVERSVNVACVAPRDGPIDSLVGQWALLHVGFAMSIIDEEEAQRTLDLLTQIGEAQAELSAMRGEFSSDMGGRRS